MIKILLIEDDADIRANTASILEMANYSVITAENGKIGVEKAILEKPDLIICDIIMPILDGYGVFHLLNKNEMIQHVPFIFLTSKADRLDFRKGMEMGADDYIPKPFTEIELLNAIESRLKRKLILQKNYSGDVNGIRDLMSDMGNVEALKHLAEDRNINNYKKKQLIYAEGNHPNKLYFILKGKVKTFKSNDEGKELTVGLYKEGEFFGYLAMLENAIYRESAQALE